MQKCPPWLKIAVLPRVMLNQDLFVKIQVLDHQGKSIKAIARELGVGVSRNTVRKYLRKPNELPTYKERKSKPSKLSNLKKARGASET